MNRPQVTVIQVGRDENGITYSGDVDTPAPKVVPTFAPVSVKTKAAAKRLGWRFTTEKPEHVREIPGTDLLERVRGYFEAEKNCSDLNGFPTTLRRCATTMKNVLEQIQQTENDRKRRGLP